MTLEERLKRYAEKGELTHLSLAFYDGQYHAKLALSSTAGGYAGAEDQDPVRALEKVFEASPVKVRRSPARDPEITVAVNDPAEREDSPLPNDWTKP